MGKGAGAAVADADLFFSDLVAHVYLYGSITDARAASVIAGLDEANRQATDLPVVLHVHSPGGYVTAGMAIIQAMRASRRPVIAVVDGIAFSMAAFLLVLADHRVATPHAVVLFHELYSEAAERTLELGAVARQVEEGQRGLEEAVARHSRIAPAALKRLLRRDKLLDAKACLRLGVVDRVVARQQRAATREGTPKMYYLFCPYADGEKGEEDDDASGVASVAEFDRFVAALREDPRPVGIRFNACDNRVGLIASLPWLARVTACPLPVHAIIDTTLETTDVLPAIACDRRIMYSTGALLLRRLEAVNTFGGAVIADAVENHEVIADIVRGVFRAHTRVPVATLEQNTTLLTPAQALRLKVADEVRPV